MRRREFIIGAGVAAWAQPPARPVIEFLHGGLLEAGVAIEYRWMKGPIGHSNLISQQKEGT